VIKVSAPLNWGPLSVSTPLHFTGTRSVISFSKRKDNKNTDFTQVHRITRY